jgi:hypothetical protein
LLSKSDPFLTNLYDAWIAAAKELDQASLEDFPAASARYKKARAAFLKAEDHQETGEY